MHKHLSLHVHGHVHETPQSIEPATTLIHYACKWKHAAKCTPTLYTQAIMVLHKPHVHYNNIIHILQSYPGTDLSAGCPVASFGHRGSAKQTGQAQYCSRLYCKL